MRSRVHPFSPFERLPRREVQEQYPVTGVIAGWFLRLGKTDDGQYRADGADLRRNTFWRVAGSEAALLAEIVAANRAWTAELRRRQLLLAMMLLGWTPASMRVSHLLQGAPWHLAMLAGFIAWLVVIVRWMTHRAERPLWLSGEKGPSSRPVR